MSTRSFLQAGMARVWQSSPSLAVSAFRARADPPARSPSSAKPRRCRRPGA
jgi:hypothetical protein